MADLPAHIRVVNARQHTLKGITVAIPRHKLTVLCGWSGSGKSTLAFDTLYAEGFSAYVESLSPYVRQFLPRMPRPAVDRIEGLAPAIALQQNRFTGGMRSTVVTLSELYPYLRLLFARTGTLYSPISGEPLQRYTLEEVVQFLLQQPPGTEVCILRPISDLTTLPTLASEGYDRILWRNTLYEWPDYPAELEADELYLVIDRLFIDPAEIELRARLMESLEEVWYTHQRQVWVWVAEKGVFSFSGQLHAEGYTFREPTPELFNYLSAYGACPTCQGKGTSLSLLPEAVLPDPRKSLQEGLVALWAENNFMQPYQETFIERTQGLIDPTLPYYAYTTQQRRLLWWGDPLRNIVGIMGSYEAELRKRDQARTLFRYQGIGPCPTCEGSRLHPDTRWIRIAGLSLPQVLSLSLAEFADWLEQIDLPEPQRTLAAPLLEELKPRTDFLLRVGLGYLTLDRPGESLSGGESQRLQLAAILGSRMTGAIYVLDEPTIGLHPRDTQRLLSAIQELRQAPNTVVVVEHEETFIRAAEHIIEMGPQSGEKGGEVIFEGTFAQLIAADTPTGRYFRRPPPPLSTSNPKTPPILLEGACLHNLKNISVAFPTEAITVITGVSGSGKTTLALKLLAPAIQEALLRVDPVQGKRILTGKQTYRRLTLPSTIEEVEVLSQNTLTRSRRSIIATVSGAFDSIRELFARAAHRSGLDIPAGYFSFNVSGGRCETCQGEGVIIKPMQFLADLRLPCPTCQGKRFQPFILEVEVGGRNISDILDFTVTEALAFFDNLPQASEKLREAIRTSLQPLITVGLGYLKLGQATTELSGGEASRLRLIPYLQPNSRHTLFVIDEPTTGLHFEDVKRLLQAFRQLVRQGHTLLIIEHNLDLIAGADWVIDLGPEGGDAGGELLYAGPVRGLLAHPASYTAAALREKYDIWQLTPS